MIVLTALSQNMEHTVSNNKRMKTTIMKKPHIILIRYVAEPHYINAALAPAPA
jgi:hypothetical protein